MITKRTYFSSELNGGETTASSKERRGSAATPFGEEGVAHVGETLGNEINNKTGYEIKCRYCLDKGEVF